jgi:hypothetical protein
MKKWIVLAVACFLSITLSLSGCFSLAEASDTKDEVIRICRNAVVGEGISSDELQTYQSSAQSYIIKTNSVITKKWLVTFQESASTDAPFVFAIYIEPTDIVQTTNQSRTVFAIAKQRIEWEEVKGLFEFWSVEDKAKFNQQVLTPLGYPSSATLPEDNDIKEAAALDIAKKALKEQWKLSDEQIGEFLIDRNFFAFNQVPSWVFCYRENNQLEQHFFKIVYSVVVDAASGEILANYAQ